MRTAQAVIIGVAAGIAAVVTLVLLMVLSTLPHELEKRQLAEQGLAYAAALDKFDCWRSRSSICTALHQKWGEVSGGNVTVIQALELAQELKMTRYRPWDVERLSIKAQVDEELADVEAMKTVQEARSRPPLTPAQIESLCTAYREWYGEKQGSEYCKQHLANRNW